MIQNRKGPDFDNITRVSCDECCSCQDLNMAKQHYFRCREVDPSGLHAPVTMALAALAAHVQNRHVFR